MTNYYSAQDLDDLGSVLKRAIELKKNPFENASLGQGKSMLLLFLNPSLRTRLSTQLAARNLGLETIVMNPSDSWKMEMEPGAIMNLDKAEHLKDAARVMSNYVDLIGIRSFSELKDQKTDYEDQVIQQFIQYATVPVVNMESAILHPLQSLADFMTIEELYPKKPCKITVSWAPHPKALPQAVVNSFLDFARLTNHEITITHPPGYELSPRFTNGCQISYNQEDAFKDADIVYTKNWSSYNTYGKVLSTDLSWTVNQDKMDRTANGMFLHCLPIRRNVIATDQVLDGPNSAIYQQAENRLYAAQAVIEKILKDQK